MQLLKIKYEDRLNDFNPKAIKCSELCTTSFTTLPLAELAANWRLPVLADDGREVCTVGGFIPCSLGFLMLSLVVQEGVIPLQCPAGHVQG